MQSRDEAGDVRKVRLARVKIVQCFDGRTERESSLRNTHGRAAAMVDFTVSWGARRAAGSVQVALERGRPRRETTVLTRRSKFKVLETHHASYYSVK